MLDHNYFRLARRLSKANVEHNTLIDKMDRHRKNLSQVFERFDAGEISESIANQFVKLYIDQLLAWEVDLIAIQSEILHLKKELSQY